MFDTDKWQEIISAISKNKLRTCLTGFSVFWGIFMLMILLGSGKGLQNGILSQFGHVTNSVTLWGGETTMECDGLGIGRDITFRREDLDLLRHGIPQISEITARRNLWGTSITYDDEYANLTIDCIGTHMQTINQLKAIDGRLLNRLDETELRKVVIIGKRALERMNRFDNPVGRYINIEGVPFLVVGVFDAQNDRFSNRLCMPLDVAQRVFMPDTKVHNICFTVSTRTSEESDRIVKKATQILAAKYHFRPEDTRAMGSNNSQANYEQVQTTFAGLTMFIAIIGIFTVIAGIVGVSNIMIIVVKERTKEIGIRKALGATPASIVGLIIQESVVITSVAGYMGLLAGVAIIEAVGGALPADGFFRSPSVDFGTAVTAAVLIVVAGALAGYVPAKRAASVRPIEALRDE